MPWQISTTLFDNCLNKRLIVFICEENSLLHICGIKSLKITENRELWSIKNLTSVLNAQFASI